MNNIQAQLLNKVKNTKPINDLKPHPLHKAIYTTPKDIKSAWGDLYSTMEESGLLCPVIVSKDNTIISGVRRWMIAKELGWKVIDVSVYKGKKEEIENLIITSNSNREKTYAEKVNEALHLLKMIGNRQGHRNLSEDEKGSRYAIVAKKMGAGFSKDNVSKIARIQNHDENNPKQLKKLLDLVKEGVSVDSVFKFMDEQKNQNTDIETIIKIEKEYTLINGDSKIELDKMNQGEIDMCFSSFPYWRQRLYQVGEKKNQVENWGEEKSIENYLESSVEISRKIYNTLKDTGSFYLNIGDTIRERQYMFIPEQLCIKIMSIGFKLVNKIVWKKKNNKPLNLDKQLQPTYEYVFHFVKDVEKFKNRVLRYKTGDKIKVSGSVGDRREFSNREKKKKIIITPYSRFRNFIDENEGSRDIIVSAVGSSKEIKKITGIDHPAVFPETLPLLAILQSTEVGDKVMDICSGSGTLGMCNLFGRKYVGIEISKEYHKCAIRRLEYFNTIVNAKEIEEFESLAMAA